MSQIDFVLFLPHLFWFIILFLAFYFLLFSFILPMVFESMKLRADYASLLHHVFQNLYVFYYTLFHVIVPNLHKSLLNLISKCFIRVSLIKKAKKKIS